MLRLKLALTWISFVRASVLPIRVTMRLHELRETMQLRFAGGGGPVHLGGDALDAGGDRYFDRINRIGRIAVSGASASGRGYIPSCRSC